MKNVVKSSVVKNERCLEPKVGNIIWKKVK